MLWFDARSALGQMLNSFDKGTFTFNKRAFDGRAFNKRANRDGRAAWGEWFGRGTFGTLRTIRAFCASGWLRWLGCARFRRSGCRSCGTGFNWRRCGRGGVLLFRRGRVFAWARGKSFAATTTATTTTSASAGAYCGRVACGFCAARNGLFTVRHSG